MSVLKCDQNHDISLYINLGGSDQINTLSGHKGEVCLNYRTFQVINWIFPVIYRTFQALFPVNLDYTGDTSGL